MPTAPKKSTAKKSTGKTNKRTTPPKSAKPKREDDEGNPLVPTSADAWGTREVPKEEGFVTELPSGNVVRMRRTLDLPVLLRSGQIPNPLAQIVRRMMDTQNPNFSTTEMTGEVLWQFMDLIDNTTMRCIVEPKLSSPPRRKKKESWEEWTESIMAWEPEEGTVSIFAIDLNDKLFVFALSQGMAADLASFREQTDAAMASLQTGGDVPRSPRGTSRTPAKQSGRKRASTRA